MNGLSISHNQPITGDTSINIAAFNAAEWIARARRAGKDPHVFIGDGGQRYLVTNEESSTDLGLPCLRQPERRAVIDLLSRRGHILAQ